MCRYMGPFCKPQILRLRTKSGLKGGKVLWMKNGMFVRFFFADTDSINFHLIMKHELYVPKFLFQNIRNWMSDSGFSEALREIGRCTWYLAIESSEIKKIKKHLLKEMFLEVTLVDFFLSTFQFFAALSSQKPDFH